jgi:hypothetical protein
LSSDPLVIHQLAEEEMWKNTEQITNPVKIFNTLFRIENFCCSEFKCSSTTVQFIVCSKQALSWEHLSGSFDDML